MIRLIVSEKYKPSFLSNCIILFCSLLREYPRDYEEIEVFVRTFPSIRYSHRIQSRKPPNPSF